MIVGGIIGSNIFNILSVLAFSAVAKPVIIESRFATYDMPIVILVTLMFAAFLLYTGKIGRLAGALAKMNIK